MADIILDAETVTVEGKWVGIRGHDLELDFEGRRRLVGGVRDTSGERRALVHNYFDGLTLNWDRDYPGGVHIEGKTRIDELEIGDSVTINRPGPARGRSVLNVTGDIVMIVDVNAFDELPPQAREVANELWRAWFVGGDPSPLGPASGRSLSIEGIAKLLADLLARIRQLEERVAALEA